MAPLIAEAKQVRLLPRLDVVFFAAALLALATGMSFIRWRRRLAESDELPPTPEIATARRLLHVEVALLALIPLMAVLMTRGIGR